VIERTGYIDIVYADDKANGSMKHFGNLGINPVESRQVYGIEDVMKVFLLFFIFAVLLLSFSSYQFLHDSQNILNSGHSRKYKVYYSQFYGGRSLEEEE